MSSEYKSFREGVFSSFHALSKEYPVYADARMLLGSAESKGFLSAQDIIKTIDTEWISVIESILPALDTVIRNPSVAIEDVDEILPVELSRHINDKSVKHLAQHTNLILDIKDDDVIPSKILNVYRDETYLTYENKFINTLLARLSAFVDKRYRALADGRGAEKKYKFEYMSEFEHHLPDDSGRNSAQMHLSIELTSPLETGASESKNESEIAEINEHYAAALERIERINQALMSYQSGVFAQKLGRNYIRPPVVRTNAILKNKNLKECLTLWEYIESFDKVGYAVRSDDEIEMPTDEYVGTLYSSMALQYVDFYNGVTKEEDMRLLSKKHNFETEPEFGNEDWSEPLDDYRVYDAEYKKLVPVSRLMNNRRKLSEDEHKIANAILVALKADEILEQIRIEEEERRRAEEEARRLAEEEARRREEEAEAQRQAEEMLHKLEEKERQMLDEEARRIAELQRLEEEARRLEEEEQARIAAELEAERRAKELFAPEDGDYDGRYPICPYTKSHYRAMGRKRKKLVKQDMESVLEYRELQLAMLRAESNEDVAQMSARCNEIAKMLSEEEGWHDILALQKKKAETDNGRE